MKPPKTDRAAARSSHLREGSYLSSRASVPSIAGLIDHLAVKTNSFKLLPGQLALDEHHLCDPHKSCRHSKEGGKVWVPTSTFITQASHLIGSCHDAGGTSSLNSRSPNRTHSPPHLLSKRDSIPSPAFPFLRAIVIYLYMGRGGLTRSTSLEPPIQPRD